MRQFNDNDCTNCGGTGSERSGVEYMGMSELVGCDWCAGTGFADINLGVERLRAEIAELSEMRELVAALAKIGNIYEDKCCYCGTHQSLSVVDESECHTADCPWWRAAQVAAFTEKYSLTLDPAPTGQERHLRCSCGGRGLCHYMSNVHEWIYDEESADGI